MCQKGCAVYGPGNTLVVLALRNCTTHLCTHPCAGFGLRKPAPQPDMAFSLRGHPGSCWSVPSHTHHSPVHRSMLRPSPMPRRPPHTIRRRSPVETPCAAAGTVPVRSSPVSTSRLISSPRPSRRCWRAVSGTGYSGKPAWPSWPVALRSGSGDSHDLQTVHAVEQPDGQQVTRRASLPGPARNMGGWPRVR